MLPKDCIALDFVFTLFEIIMMHILKTLCLFKYRNDNPGFKCTYHVGHCYFHLSQTCYNYYQIKYYHNNIKF